MANFTYNKVYYLLRKILSARFYEKWNTYLESLYNSGPIYHSLPSGYLLRENFPFTKLFRNFLKIFVNRLDQHAIYPRGHSNIFLGLSRTAKFQKKSFRRDVVWSQRWLEVKSEYAYRHHHPREPLLREFQRIYIFELCQPSSGSLANPDVSDSNHSSRVMNSLFSYHFSITIFSMRWFPENVLIKFVTWKMFTFS